jgi:hypothetical protein
MAELPSGFRVVKTTPQKGLPPGFRIVNEGPALPSAGADILSTAPSTLGRGALAIPGMVGDFMGLGMQAGRKIDQLLGNPVKSSEDISAANPLRGVTSEGLEEKYEQATGTQFYDAQTPEGQVVDRVLRPVPGAAVMGGGNPFKAGVKYGAGPAAGGEVAAQGAQSMGLDEGYQTAARVATEVIAGGTGSLTKPKDRSPSLTQLTKDASDGFAAVERAGVTINQTGLAKLAANASAVAKKRLTNIPEIDRELSPDTLTMLKGIGAMARQGTVPLTTVHKYRQMLGSELRRGDIRDADRAVLQGVKRQIDDFFENLDSSQVASGDPRTGPILKKAINSYARQQRAETIRDTIKDAELRIDPKTGYTREDALRAAFKNLANDTDAMAGFSAKERAAIEEIKKGAPIARALSGLSPSNNIGSLIRLGFAGSALGYATENAWLAGAPPVAGALGKAASSAATRRNVARADQLVRGGAGSVPSGPMMAPLSLYYGTTSAGFQKDKNGVPVLDPQGQRIPR